MNHETGNKILASIHDSIGAYTNQHIDMVVPHLNAIHNDPVMYKARHHLVNDDVWGLLFEHAKVVGCTQQSMTTIYKNKLESDFIYMYGHINWHTSNQSTSGRRNKVGSEPQRYALTHGLIDYIKKDIDYTLIPDNVVSELCEDLKSRYYTKVYEGGDV